MAAVIVIEIIISISPIILAVVSFLCKYMNPGISPRGGSRTLKMISPSVLKKENLNGTSFMFFPQCGQNIKSSFTGVEQYLHVGLFGTKSSGLGGAGLFIGFPGAAGA